MNVSQLTPVLSVPACVNEATSLLTNAIGTYRVYQAFVLVHSSDVSQDRIQSYHLYPTLDEAVTEALAQVHFNILKGEKNKETDND